MRALVWLIALMIVAGCKAAAWRKQKADAEMETGQPPQVVRSSEATPAMAQIVEIDEKTGRTKADLVLRLDYVPPPAPGVTTLPTCYPAFRGDFEIGSFMCEGRPETQRSLLAKNVDQECYTDSRRGRLAAAEPVSIPSCRRGVIESYRFEPNLRLDVEVRDVN